MICGDADPRNVHAMVRGAFAELEDCEVIALDSAAALAAIPAADYSIATLWTTAYVLLRVTNTALKFYFIQDYEPLFYPAGSTSAQVELTYRFGFYGLANTRSIREIYEREFGAIAHHIEPCVDGTVFHDRDASRPADVRRVFYYARPGIPRNGFELATAALRRVKARLGDRVDILCAGANWNPADYGLQNVVRTVGLLPYAQTGSLYRSCHVGLALMMTRHPSYLPFELIACGCTVVANQNPANAWLLRDRETALVAPASATGIAQTLIDAVESWDDQAEMRARAMALIRGRHSDWNGEFVQAYRFLVAPTSTPTPNA
jgi:glycosyltransferase involved in cell wall biosynthesis